MSVSPSLAAAAIVLTFAQLTAAQPWQDALPVAPVVVIGTVDGIESRWDAATNTIVTYVGVQVERRLRGTTVPDRIVLKQLGGRVGDIGLFIAGQATFLPGERTLLLLAVDAGDGTLHTASLDRGKQSADVATVAAVQAALAAATPVSPVPFVAVPAGADSDLAPPAFSHLPTDGGYPARWHQVDDGGAVFVDHSPVPGTWTGAATARATDAINLWRNSGMELDLRDGGVVLNAGTCYAGFNGNGRISVSYNNPCGSIVPPDAWVVGGGYYTTGDLRTVGGVTYQKFLQGFVVLNTTGPQTGSAGCFQDAITHGIGHALGLGHTDSNGAIMRAQPPCGGETGSALGADDVTGITTIYQGIPSGPFPPAAPTALSASVTLSTLTLNWTPASTGGAPTRYILAAGTASNVYNIGSFTFNAPATSAVFTDVPQGTYFVRVAAQNPAGTSGPSPEAQVTVGACAAPGAPGTLSHVVNDQSVHLQWSAPATGLAQGYRLIVGSAPGLANVLVTDTPATVTSLAAAGVPYGTYYARVVATNACGTSPPSNEVVVSVQPCSAAPQPPTGLNFNRVGTFVALGWSAPAAGPTPSSYVLVAGSTPGAGNLLVYSTGSTATSTGATAPPGTYYVRMLAQNACGLSGASNEVVVTVP